MPKKETCFVLSPFREPFDTYYKEILRPAVLDARFTPLRADEIYSARPIMRDVWDGLDASRMILAEMTGRNPNVLYEVGLAHALGKPVIMITETIEDIPFDLRAIRCITYQTKNPRWDERLRKAITKTLLSALSLSDPGEMLWGRRIGSALNDAKKLDELFGSTTYAALMLVAALAEIGGGPITFGDLLIRLRESNYKLNADEAIPQIRECLRKELLVCLDPNGRQQDDAWHVVEHAGHYLTLTPLGKQIAVLWVSPGLRYSKKATKKKTADAS